MSTPFTAAAFAAILLAPLAALAGPHHGAGAHGAMISHAGSAGQAADVARTLDIGMLDTMRFAPGQLQFARGQTVRLVVRNQGEALHEIVIGTREDIVRHRQAMREDPDMAHGAPHMAHVAPGATHDLVWKFDRAGQFEFACLLPGHYEAGMRGTITVL
jgi:uncharacterized cupredoxin-like copper-binding protein